jgi:hypothetical protein
MPALSSPARNAGLAALAALVLLAPTVSASAGDGVPTPTPPKSTPQPPNSTPHPILPPIVRDHRSVRDFRTPTQKILHDGSYDTEAVLVRDHRSKAGSGAASMPAGHSPK